MIRGSILLALTLSVVLFAPACTHPAPAKVAAVTAHNGTIVVDAIDKVQDYVITHQRDGSLPTPEADAVMTGIKTTLTAAQKLPDLLRKLAALSPSDPLHDDLITQIRSVLVDVANGQDTFLVPINNLDTRAAVAGLSKEVTKTLDIVYGWINQNASTGGEQ